MNRKATAALALLNSMFLAALVIYSQPPRPNEIPMPQAIAFRVLFGLTDKEPTAWNGKVTVTSGKVVDIQGWRFNAQDSTDHAASWKLSTRRGLGNVGSNAPGPMLENGILLSLAVDDPTVPVTLDTAQGNFSFRPADVPAGTAAMFLNRAVRVDRVPATFQLTSSPEEQDFPAAALDGDDVWVAYVEFVHGDRSQDLPRPLRNEPDRFDALARPAGGDQVFLLRYSRSRRVWSAPVAVTASGQDVARAAVAVDGSHRVWVFYSAQRDGNFDIYAKALANGRWASETRLTWDPGTDLNPVAAADSNGRVWVAWQGFREDNFEVLAAAQNGDAFTGEAVVSSSPASDWDPAIAAGPSGEVAVSWDTYDQGNYDVYLRRLRFDREVMLGEPVAVAAGEGFEARSSVAYDPQGRLWVAYETSGPGWGKDFGAYETTGIALYQGHNVAVRCFQSGGRFETVAPLTSVLPSQPGAGSYGQNKLGPPNPTLQQPDPNLAQNRKPNGGPGAPALPRNSFPRLTIDSQGMVYLAFRSSSGVRVGVGTTWFEQVAWFDGAQWRGPLFVPNADGLLDSRPALVPLAPGNVLVISATDHRQSNPGPVRGGDVVNTDLYAADLRLGATAQAPKLQAATDAPAQDAADPEAGPIELMRSYRVSAGGSYLRLLRGEFHRHTEISADGGNDGPLVDAYRYLIDAASMDWAGCCDHDNGGGREYSWWLEQKLTDAYHLGEKFVPMFSYERSVSYPEGHRNVLFAQRGIRTLPRLPVMSADSAPTSAPDTQMLYHYLRQFNGVAASHTSGTDMGTDWRDNDPGLEPLVEIYQGDRQNYERPDAPRANSAADSIGGWRPLGFVSLALDKGYRLAFESSSDHISTHMSYANLWVTEPTRDAILEALLKRRVYGSTANILADVRSGDHFMGEEFTVSAPPSISVQLWGAANFAQVYIVKDNQYVYSIQPGTQNVQFVWRDDAAVKGRTSFYYVRGEQEDGELVWVSPMWITYQ